ncbi:MAG: hypothetical protein HY928_00115, partial [Elusimicrobia bacterium]|nr:hypothetical protein [Elusimicrobiota bacterium]
RLSKFLLRHGLVWRETTAWTKRHREWLRGLRWELESHARVFEAYLRGAEAPLCRVSPGL